MKIIYEDKDIIVYDKPAGVNADEIRFRAHRLDKDTSGVLVAAKNKKALAFLQKQFAENKVEKKYYALVVGKIKKDSGTIETFLARSPKDKRKQKAYLSVAELGLKKPRKALTKYRVIKRFKDFTLLEVIPKTGRKHQIRAHMTYLGHPIAGDKLYRFRNQPCPPELSRQFLHATAIKIRLPNGRKKEFKSPLPEDLKKVLLNLSLKENNEH